MSLESEITTYEAARRSMVDGQVRPSDVTRPSLIDAMLWTPRERFVPKSKRSVAYMGEAIDVAPGRVELDPRTLAKMIEAAAPTADDLALVIGSGGGYAAAILSQLCAAVVAVEQDEALAAAGREALTECGVDTVITVVGPHVDGCLKHAPYNLILINGAVSAPAGEIDPLATILQAQLADGGRLATLRRDGPAGRCEVVVKSGETWSARRAFDAASPILAGFEAPARFEF